MPELVTLDAIRRVLEDSHTIAVLGAHTQRIRAACYVPEYLHSVGYRIFPVNPRFAGQTLWQAPVTAQLADLETPIDMVDVFRPADKLFGHLDDILAMQPLPRVVWLQLRIRNDDFARHLLDAGIDVVQDRCTLADHRMLHIEPRT